MHRWSAVFLGVTLFVATSPIAQADHAEAREIRWACGGFSSGHPDYCGIDPVGGGEEVNSDGEPEFKIAGNGDWIPDDARVLGIEHEGEVDAPEGRGTPTIAWFGVGLVLLVLLAALGLLRSTRKQL